MCPDDLFFLLKIRIGIWQGRWRQRQPVDAWEMEGHFPFLFAFSTTLLRCSSTRVPIMQNYNAEKHKRRKKKKKNVPRSVPSARKLTRCLSLDALEFIIIKVKIREKMVDFLYRTGMSYGGGERGEAFSKILNSTRKKKKRKKNINLPQKKNG